MHPHTLTNKKIIIAGGSVFMGQNLAKWFAANNQIVILTRNITGSANNKYSKENIANSNTRYVQWDGKTQGKWSSEIDGCDLVINLSGKSVNCRYNERNKKEIFDSRTDSTKALGEAIRRAADPPALWINAASATIYRHAEDRPQDEYTGEFHNDFSVQVCQRWEKTFFEEETSCTRKVALRTAITLGCGGVMTPYLNLCKWGLGGKQGSGRQMFSWVHIDDVCRAIEFLWHHNTLTGVFNLSAPNPVSNAVFMEKLRKTTGNRIGLPAMKWQLKLGAAIIGTETELLLKSRWVLPTRLLEEGFTFSFATVDAAFNDIVSHLPRKAYHLF
ncbi:TIGR01777 family oxidoreductase [Danxiaibacter flavus]|uniref:TIGR01777 family oxidoreductase n=1 Tax=Danxiaibacter flavus TaxID=3049108 RepID=A0ABV3ZM24_9BACT|nr:TIGR01777 family oxidoreductase [Chitinophagaceae bacterium DXS]